MNIWTNIHIKGDDILANEDLEQGFIDYKKIEKIKKKMVNEDVIFDMAELFKVFGDSTRMKIISALLQNELCVGEIAEITNSTQSAISHQLRVLKQAKLVKFKKVGKTVYYSLDDDHIYQIYKYFLIFNKMLYNNKIDGKNGYN